MEGRDQPLCSDCIVPLTLKHVLAECPSLLDFRRQCYPDINVRDYDQIMLRMLAENDNERFSIDKLLTYLRLCNILDHL